MLKDITLGQFFPGNTIVHRLDPRTKILAVVLYIVALFSADSVLTYAIVMVALTVSILVSKVPFRSLTKGLKPIVIIVIFTAVMNLFFTKGTPVCDVWLLRHITCRSVGACWWSWTSSARRTSSSRHRCRRRRLRWARTCGVRRSVTTRRSTSSAWSS